MWRLYSEVHFAEIILKINVYNLFDLFNVKIISVRVHLVGTGGIGHRQILPQTIGIN